jgi:hypothetical protein
LDAHGLGQLERLDRRRLVAGEREVVMADYQLTNTDAVLRTADQVFIPNDPLNTDRIAYEQWLADGGVPDPVTPPIYPALDSVGTGKTTNQILGVA